MLLKQLEYFVALARERHFGRAAEACRVSQSALSEAIRKLEIELDVPLVRRGHAFEGITLEGERLLPWAKRMVADQTALHDAAKAIGGSLTGMLRLGAVPSATLAAAQLVDRFAARHPQVAVRIETGLPAEEIVRRIRSFELDAGVIYPTRTPTPDLTTALLSQERQQVVMSPALADGRRRITAAELSELPLALLDATMRGRQILDRHLQRLDVTLHPQVTADSVEALIALVRTERWAGVIPSAAGGGLELPNGTVAVELVEAVVTSPVVLATLAVEPVSVLARGLMRVARSSAD